MNDVPEDMSDVWSAISKTVADLEAKGYSAESAAPVEPSSDLRRAANHTRQLYVALVDVGFTDEDAKDFVKAILAPTTLRRKYMMSRLRATPNGDSVTVDVEEKEK